MAKFIILPAKSELSKESFHIDQPDFTNEISEYVKKAPGQIQKHALRNTINKLALEYAPDAISFPNIPYCDYEGSSYNTIEDAGGMVYAILKKHAPHIVDSYVRRQIRNRPTTAKVVYFRGDQEFARLFLSEGLDLAEHEFKPASRSRKTKEQVEEAAPEVAPDSAV